MNRTEFKKELLKAMQDMPIEAACRQLKVSIPTLERWMQGISAPHTIGREAVMRALI